MDTINSLLDIILSWLHKKTPIAPSPIKVDPSVALPVPAVPPSIPSVSVPAVLSPVPPPAIPMSATSPKPGTILDETKHMVYVITSAFEGATLGEINYGNITGNFDDMGLSIGFLQWCTGQSSDLALFKAMADQYPEVLKRAMGDLYDGFVSTLSWNPARRLSWAVGINNGVHIKEPWLTALKNMCRTKEFQGIQFKSAESKMDASIVYCDVYGLKTIRGLALMFDILTQNGSIKSKTKDQIFADKKMKEQSLGRALTEKEFLSIIAIDRANAANAQWIGDVKARKLCIATGKGYVHGDYYDFDRLGLSDTPFRTT